MIKLDTFFIRERTVTVNWSEVSLIATDRHSNKKVIVATCSFATGMLDKYPNKTKEKAISNVEKLKYYLIDSDIKTESDWDNKASLNAKIAFVSCFSTNRPFFTNGNM